MGRLLCTLLSSLWLSLFTTSAIAELVVKDAFVRVLPPGVPNTSAYFTITNTGDTSRFLVSATSKIADTVELHNHVMDGEMMRMEQQDSVEVKAGQTVNFAPGGLHLMVFGLMAPLQSEQQVTFQLMTRDGEQVKFTATGRKPGDHSHHHH